ncbi:cobalt ECF transporter T component CbiQ [Halarsenatibacter silvermanii]|uniref:Cobalt/nickel transport system permease protein n=1 Tax=Halarsenatibacter silvermanii TaxID=321763 RepID=A0A1G9QKX5_9FIRM|nr:cobalt ECF transporter T component CbiQ [Halarsenatibacter silvermanii]SDM11674.1 cobalt/nickel transport system permease protein [Halarsenatibacter silvermanii]
MLTAEFSRGDSLIHSLDPRIKIVILVMMAAVTAAGKNLFMLVSALVFSLVLVLAAGLRTKKVIKRLSLLNIFIVSIWILIPFTYPGEVLAAAGPFTVTSDGIIYALRITLRSNAVMLAVFALLSTSSVSSLMQALKYFHVPKKLIYLFFFVYRYIFVLQDEFSNMQKSVEGRGFTPATSVHCYKTYAFLIGMLLIKSYERAARVYQAMLARGFKGEFYVKDELEFSAGDVLVFSCGFLLMVLFFELEFGVFI